MSTKTNVVYKRFDSDMYSTNGNPLRFYQGPTTSVVKNFGRSRTGVANPKWKTQIRDAENASTSFTAFESTGEATAADGEIRWKSRSPSGPSPFWESFTHKGYFTWNTPGVLATHSGNTASLVDANAIAVRNLHRAIERAQHQFSGGVFVGQLGQAVRMVISPAKALRTSMASYFSTLQKRRRGVKPEKLRKVLAETYLEYTFGWQPLLMDVKDAAKAIHRFSNPNSERKRFRCKGEDQKQMSNVAEWQAITSYYPVFWYRKYTTTQGRAVVVYYGLFSGGVLDPMAAATQSQKVQALSGFDLRSFVPTAWELLPWSFLVDYFTNIGDLIMAYSHCTSIVKWLTKVEILSSENEIRAYPAYDSILNGLNGLGVTAAAYERVIEGLMTRSKATYRSVTRTPTTVPFPTLKFEVPSVDSRKWLNIAALVLGARPKSPFYK